MRYGGVEKVGVGAGDVEMVRCSAVPCGDVEVWTWGEVLA